MEKLEITGIITACIFATLGFSESGFVAAVGTAIFATFATIAIALAESGKRKKFLHTKKALIRKRARA